MKIMKSKLEKLSIIKRNELNEIEYFESLIEETLKVEMISINDISNLQIQLLELLRQRVEKYNNFESSSIIADKAKIIMESNIYTIQIALKKYTPDEGIEKLKNTSIIDLYYDGRKLIDRKISISKLLYRKVLNNLNNINNETYNATIRRGIKGFFKIYDPDFNAKDIKITADYPLYNNLIGKLEGIEFIEKYLEYIYYENEFCNMFSQENIEYLLYNYSHDYSDLDINIFRIVFIQVIGCILAKENYIELKLTNKGIEKINRCFTGKTKDKIYQLIYNSYQKIKIDKMEISKYVENGIEEIQSEIYNGFKLGNLDKIFIIEKMTS